MINVETKDGKIAVKCGEATGADLSCEASAAVVSVIGAAIKRCKSKKRKEALAKEVFVNSTGMAATIVEKEHVSRRNTASLYGLMMTMRTMTMKKPLSPRTFRWTVRLVGN